MNVTDNALRPATIDKVIGCEQVKRRIKISIHAAQQRGDVMPHVMFSGPAGTGKTSLALCVANAVGTNLVIANAASLKEPKDLFISLKNMERGDVFLIDEIHQLPRKLEDFMLTVMEDFRFDVPFGSSRNKVISSYDLEKFTLIGATTHVGLVAPPLRDRFRFKEELSLYSVDELAHIIAINAGKLGRNIQDEAAKAIAIRSRGTPRISVNHLMWVRDFAHYEGSTTIDTGIVERAMEEKGIDRMGLVDVDRRYLSVLFNLYDGGPTGLQTMASSLNTVPETLAESVEPYLMQIGLIARSSTGRCLTTAGLKYCKNMFCKTH